MRGPVKLGGGPDASVEYVEFVLTADKTLTEDFEGGSALGRKRS